jgi:quinol monooxygenase YgiN
LTEQTSKQEIVYEIAEIDVRPGEEIAFEAAVVKAAPLFKKAKGCRSLELHRTVERPSTYRLFVGWDSIEDHTVSFRSSAEFVEWRRIASPYFASPPRVEHVTIALTAF